MGEIKSFAPKEISEQIKSAGDTFRLIQNQREAMKEIEIDGRVQAEILGRMFIEHDIITSTQLNIIKNELIKPSFDYKAVNSLWELYQYTTFAMKELHPALWLNNHISVHDFFTKSGIKSIKTDFFDISSAFVSSPVPRQITLDESILDIESNGV